MPSKEQLRASFLATRDKLKAADLAKANLSLSKNMQSIWAECSSKLWTAYKAMGSEPDLESSLLKVSSTHQFAYPRVHDDDLKFYVPDSSSAQWVKTSWGIWEPDPRTCREVKLSECGAALVPGVVFDRRGNRLGYGKGFYDRALQNFGGLKVGVTFEVCLSYELLPVVTQDVAMDLIVTDQGIYRTA